MTEKQFDDTGIEAVKSGIRYRLVSLPDIANWLLEMATTNQDVRVCHREDIDANGNVTPYFYIELSGKSFEAMGGVEFIDSGEVIPIKSKKLRSVFYDPASESLIVEFHTSKTQKYQGVPRQVYERLVTTQSPTYYFDFSISGKFEFVDAEPVTD